MTDRQDWAPLLADLARRRADTQSMGGAEKVARQRARGRLPARERVAALVDAGSFVEIGALAGPADHAADAFITGHGLIDGRRVLVGVEDGTVAGGSIGVAGASKRHHLTVLARRERCPLILVLEGAGHRATNSLTAHRPAPNDLQGLAECSGIVPVVVVAAGPSAGHGALAAPLADYVVLVREQGALFTAGPPLVKASTGEAVTVQGLGGAGVHAEISGLVHAVADDEPAAYALVRRFLALMPASAFEVPPAAEPDTAAERAARRRGPIEELLDLIPVNTRRPYDMHAVLDRVVDDGSSLELAAGHGRSILTVLARIAGRPALIVANQPSVLAGAIDVAAADKAARAITLADAFHLPAVFLTDNPGVLAGSASEQAGILRAAARMFVAQHRLTSPKVQVTIRKAFGFGSSVMAANPFDSQTVSLALPTATLGGIPAAVGASTSGADRATAEALVAAEGAGPWRLASSATYDDVIDPRELRDAIIDALALAAARVEGRSGSVRPVRHTGTLI